MTAKTSENLDGLVETLRKEAMDAHIIMTAQEEEIERLTALLATERERCALIADAVQASMEEECDFGAGMAARKIRENA